MIKVQLGGTELLIAPKRLLDYCEKIDFIKSRRERPWDLLQKVPKNLSAQDFTAFVEVAMQTCYKHSSAVSIQEEMQFDTSEEGFYYDLWRSIRAGRPASKRKQAVNRLTNPDAEQKEPWRQGIMDARTLWRSATEEEKAELRAALFATDQQAILKKSDGPPESEKNDPGATGPKQESR
jgi:hypothetical protein